MTETGRNRLKRWISRMSAKADGRLIAIAVAATCVIAGAAGPALAQGWWPWNGNQQQQRPPPLPREPVYGQPDSRDPDAPPPPQGQPPLQGQNWAAPGAVPGRSNICLELEQRLVQEGQRGSESRNLIPMVETELRQTEQAYRATQKDLERGDCYEYFLFSKTLRRTRRCVDLANQADASRRRVDDLEVQLQQMQGSSGKSYQDEIVRELARNNCGANYQQQARRQEGGNSGFWEDEESSSSGGGSGFGTLPYATYKTVCVRLCDGYYFPISFSTLPNHFQRDEEACQSKCASPAELYYHQNPGAGMDQAVAARTNELYTQLKVAFRYRKEFVNGCSCKMAEYVPEPGAAPHPQQGALPVAPEQFGGPPTGAVPGGEADPSGQAAAVVPPAPRAPNAGETLPWSRTP